MENTFKKSDSIANLAKALGQFHSEVNPVKKDSENPFFRSKYAPLENIIEEIKIPLKNSKLSYTQFPTGNNSLVTILMHESGEYIESTMQMSPKENTPQGQGSAITYMRRYALSAILGLATEEDDDGNEATKPRQVAKAPIKPVEAPKVSIKASISNKVKVLRPEANKDTVKEIVKQLTNLELVEENFTEIDARLGVLISEQK